MQISKSFAPILNQEKGFYNPNWSQSNQTQSNDTNINLAFKYQNSREYDSFPYFGVYNEYLGGGYTYELVNSHNKTQVYNSLSLLQKMNWIDKQTRAVFIEFSLYNPNVNSFSYSVILFEFLPSGNLIKSAFDLLLHKLNKVRFKIFLKIFLICREELKETANLKLQLPNI